jgi:hypothetical protein
MRYKYEQREVSKLPYKWEVNKRAAEATRRPTVKQLRSDEIITLSLVFGVLLFDIIIFADMYARWWV